MGVKRPLCRCGTENIFQKYVAAHIWLSDLQFVIHLTFHCGDLNIEPLDIPSNMLAVFQERSSFANLCRPWLANETLNRNHC